MLQKVLVVLVGLVMSVVGALSPSGLFAANDARLGAPGEATAEEALATVRAADGAAFARLGVLWVEVDGRRVTEDAWGTGEVKELRFKVGAKDVEGVSLAVGDKLVPLRPTDVLTVRTFRGDFAFRHVDTPQATLQLQGTVKTTLVGEGLLPGKLRTEGGAAPGGTEAGGGGGESSARASRLAYVVLDTGQSIDTVALQEGGDRLRTDGGEVDNGAPGNLLVKWVKVDGKAVREYTWADGAVERIEFEPALGSDGVSVSFRSADATPVPGRHAVVKGFVGEYLVYQVPGGLLRLRLDGYAEDFTTGAASGAPVLSGPGAPHAAFEVVPENPTTTDVVTFKDRSTDDGIVVFWKWGFGDGVMTSLQDPTHRFAKPGVYEVTLNVTDDDLQTTQVSRTLVVRNAPPVAAFAFAPQVVTSDALVQFTDQSVDLDGQVVNWTWTFGDGSTDHQRSPSHRFAKSGPMTVSLTVRDDLGATHTVERAVLVRNAPPAASFEYGPNLVKAGIPIRFSSTSVDRDGDVVAWAWSFGDDATAKGPQASGPDVYHTFRFAGAYPVRLTVTDDLGATDTVTLLLAVNNDPPVAHFEVHGEPPLNTASTLRFVNLADDPDGVILLSSWNFGDGTNTTIATRDGQLYAERINERNVNATFSAPDNGGVPRPGPVEHRYKRPGDYDVVLCVTDNLLAETCTSMRVSINASAPLAAFRVDPNPTYRHVPAVFTDLSTDIDGDRLVAWTWDFGDGATSADPQTTTHRYAALGTYTATLTVEDETGRAGVATKQVRVVNHPPIPRVASSTTSPAVGQTVYINASAIDPDESPGPLNYTWTFADTPHPVYGERITHVFSETGVVGARLVVRDGEDGVSNPLLLAWTVSVAPPVARFDASTLFPQKDQRVDFTDRSTTFNGAITSWTWSYNQGTPFSHDPNPSYNWSAPGPYDVTLVVTDESGLQSAPFTQRVRVNAPPVASFVVTPSGGFELGRPVRFTDGSTDPDRTARNDLTDGIKLRTWDFDDGGPPITTASLAIDYTFTRPGPHVVRLVVEDQYGGTDDAVKTLTVADRRPVAIWSYSPAQPKIGDAVQFTGSADSYDPDGLPLVSWEWSFGDGAVSTGAADPTHVYARSGVHVVKLVVGDGYSQSLPAQRSVRVSSDLPLDVHVRARLPDGTSWADLRDAGLKAELTLWRPLSTPLALAEGSPFAYTAEGGTWALAPGEWAAGDRLVVRLFDARYMDKPMERSFTLRDGDADLLAEFDLPILLVPAIVADPGQAGSGALASEERARDGGAIYHDATETFRGSGRVTYVGGAPADGATVEVQLRYVPGYLPTMQRPLRDDAAAPPTNLLGWCTVGTYDANATGDFAWEAGPDSSCTFAQQGKNPPGRYEVRAIATMGFATAGVSDPATLYVDPTGVLANVFLP